MVTSYEEKSSGRIIHIWYGTLHRHADQTSSLFYIFCSTHKFMMPRRSLHIATLW